MPEMKAKEIAKIDQGAMKAVETLADSNAKAIDIQKAKNYLKEKGIAPAQVAESIVREIKPADEGVMRALVRLGCDGAEMGAIYGKLLGGGGDLKVLRRMGVSALDAIKFKMAQLGGRRYEWSETNEGGEMRAKGFDLFNVIEFNLLPGCYSLSEIGDAAMQLKLVKNREEIIYGRGAATSFSNYEDAYEFYTKKLMGMSAKDAFNDFMKFTGFENSTALPRSLLRAGYSMQETAQLLVEFEKNDSTGFAKFLKYGTGLNGEEREELIEAVEAARKAMGAK